MCVGGGAGRKERGVDTKSSSSLLKQKQFDLYFVMWGHQLIDEPVSARWWFELLCAVLDVVTSVLCSAEAPEPRLQLRTQSIKCKATDRL